VYYMHFDWIENYKTFFMANAGFIRKYKFDTLKHVVHFFIVNIKWFEKVTYLKEQWNDCSTLTILDLPRAELPIYMLYLYSKKEEESLKKLLILFNFWVWQGKNLKNPPTSFPTYLLIQMNFRLLTKNYEKSDTCFTYYSQ
jgi:hypothetical protein